MIGLYHIRLNHLRLDEIRPNGIGRDYALHLGFGGLPALALRLAAVRRRRSLSNKDSTLSLTHSPPSLPPSLALSLSLPLSLSLSLSLPLFFFGACGVSDVLPSFLLSGLSPPGGPGPRPPSPCLVGGRGLVESVVGAVPRGCFNVWRLLGAHPRPCTLTYHQASSPRPLRQGP